MDSRGVFAFFFAKIIWDKGNGVFVNKDPIAFFLGKPSQKTGI